MKIRRILVPIDFSDHSREALKVAYDLASQTGARTMLLHALEPIYFAGAPRGQAYDGPITMEQFRDAEDAMARLVESESGRKTPVSGKVVSGSAADEILKTAESSDADLIVMSTHGRSGLSRAILGSVAEKVLRGASCPVLTTRPVDIDAENAV